MFNAYAIAIKVSMINAVTPQLSIMQKQFGMLATQADIFKNKLSQIKSLALVGGTLFAAGALGFAGILKMSKPAQDYLHQLNLMKIAGMSQLEIAQATGAAWQDTKDMITSNPTQNLKYLTDLRNILGTDNKSLNFQTAIKALPIMLQTQTALWASSADKNIYGTDLITPMSEALALMSRNKDPVEFIKEFEMMGQAMSATQMRANPMGYYTVFRRLQQTRNTLDDYFLYRILPTLITENAAGGTGGKSKGLGNLASQIRGGISMGVQGNVNRMSLLEFGKLGLVNPNSALSTTTQGTTVHPFKNYELLMKDPFSYFEQMVKPAIIKQYGMDFYKNNNEMSAYFLQLARGNSGFAGLMGEFYEKEDLLLRNADMIGRAAMGPQGYALAIKNDPQAAYYALSQQWTTLKTAMFIPIATILIPTLMKLATWFSKVSDVLIKYPNMIKYIDYAFIGLAGSLMFGGMIILLTAAFKGLFLVIAVFAELPLLFTAVAVGLVAYGLYKLYEIVKHNFNINGWVKNFNILIGWIEKFNNVMAKSTAALPSILTGGAFNPGLDPKQNAVIGSLFADAATGGALSPAEKALFSSPTKRPSPIAPRNQNNNQPQNIIMKVNGDVLGKVALNHVSKNANRVANNISTFDSSMSLTPVLLQASALF